MNRENLVAQLFTVRDYCTNLEDFTRSMEKIAKIGYGGIQASGIGPMDPKDVRRVCDEFGLKIVVTHRPFEEFIGKKLEQTIEMHDILGCAYPGIGSMPGNLYPRTKDGYAAFGQVLAGVCSRLPDRMHLVYHNHNFEFCRFDGKTGHEILFENAGDKLMAELDTFWITAGGAEPSAYIRRFKDRLDVIHLKDYGVNENGERKMREVGEGNENWPAILDAVAYSNVKYLAVEQDDCNGADPFDCLATSFKNLCAMLSID
jgi:sugar phosphate isomerase/epimerase